MDSKHTELAGRLRDARRAQRISQASLAKQAGCTQSAVSMMELGRPDAVSQETLQKIALLLNVPYKLDEIAPAAAPAIYAGARHRCCPQAECPSNIPWCIGNTVVFWPQRQPSDHNGDFCAYCGEVLLAACPECGADIGEGGHCSRCGAAYVNQPTPIGMTPAQWTLEQRRQLAAWRELQRPTGV